MHWDALAALTRRPDRRWDAPADSGPASWSANDGKLSKAVLDETGGSGTVEAFRTLLGDIVRSAQSDLSLACQLHQLKTQSRQSYATLARKTYISRSSLHRICTGARIPDDFGTVESIALSCGARREEVDVLYITWKRATHPSRDGVLRPPATASKARTASGVILTRWRNRLRRLVGRDHHP